MNIKKSPLTGKLMDLVFTDEENTNPELGWNSDVKWFCKDTGSCWFAEGDIDRTKARYLTKEEKVFISEHQGEDE